jgi:indolepyruvate ferredoxin oxidoreductase alpha subunit
LQVKKDQCKGCRACMKIGCPAIAFREQKAEIDPTQCVGCKVCVQLCKFGALSGGEVRA